MVKNRIAILLSAGLLLTISCTSTKYIYDPVSKERQKDLTKHRSGHVFSDIGMSIASVFSMVALDFDVELIPQGQDFKKLKIQNSSKDTLYINMLTDVYWDEQNYCDFMDIRIPPKEKCRLLVPVDANYNLYFSATSEQDDDEFFEINTNDFRKISLYPGISFPEEDELNSVRKE